MEKSCALCMRWILLFIKLNMLLFSRKTRNVDDVCDGLEVCLHVLAKRPRNYNNICRNKKLHLLDKTKST